MTPASWLGSSRTKPRNTEPLCEGGSGWISSFAFVDGARRSVDHHPLTSTLSSPPSHLHPLTSTRSPPPSHLHPLTSTLSSPPSHHHPLITTLSSPLLLPDSYLTLHSVSRCPTCMRSTRTYSSRPTSSYATAGGSSSLTHCAWRPGVRPPNISL